MMERPIITHVNVLRLMFKFLIKDIAEVVPRKVLVLTIMERKEAIGTLIKCLQFIMLLTQLIQITIVSNNIISIQKAILKVLTMVLEVI